MQAFADGQVMVLGHGGQQKKFCYSTEVSKRYLNDTSIIDNDPVICSYAIQVSGDTRRCEGDLQEGEIF